MSTPLSYNPPQPQEGDSELTIDHKTAVAIGGGYSVKHIATNDTFLVKTGAGILHSVSINTKGATSNIVTIYDGIDNSGAVLAVVDSTLGQITLLYDLNFTTGLCIVTSAGTAADITVCYR